MKYDLEERTAKFAENIIGLLRTIRITPLNSRIIDQLVGSSGSIGANYNEANEGESRKDFFHSIGLDFWPLLNRNWLINLKYCGMNPMNYYLSFLKYFLVRRFENYEI